MSDKLKFWKDKLLSKPVVILISGKAGVGKDTSADYVSAQLMTDYGYTCTRASFATSVKAIARERFGWNDIKGAKGRKLLQDIGRIGREYDIDIWARKLVNNYYDISPTDFVVVSDWRFPNEKDYLENLQSFQVVTIRIEAPDREVLVGTSEYLDVSEFSLPHGYVYMGEKLYDRVPTRYYDFIVDNTGAFEDLHKQLDWILNTLLGENKNE